MNAIELKRTESLPVVNATEDGLRLPEVGIVHVSGHTAIALRSGDTVIGLPASAAADIAFDIIELLAERTGSVDRGLLERLIVRAIEVRCKLMALHDSGRTHETPAASDDTLLAGYLQ